MQITYNKTGGVARWDSDDWISGLIPHFSDNQNTILGKGFSQMQNINIWRKPGYILPSFLASDVTNVSVATEKIKHGVSINNLSYLISDTLIHQFNADTNTLTSNASIPHTISAHAGHNTVIGQEVIEYYIGSTKYLFYSWYDSNDGDVGRHDLNLTFDDDWMSTSPTNATVLGKNKHPMIVGSDDILYIGDGNVLHSFDGQTGALGTLDLNGVALTLPKNFVITSFSKLSNYLVIYGYRDISTSGTNYRSECTAYFWDYVSEDPTLVYPLVGDYVSAGFEYRGTVGCFTSGKSSSANSTTQLRCLLYSNGGFTPIIQIDGDMVENGGVEITGNVINFLSGSDIYQYGSPYIGLGDKTLTKILSGSGTGTGGLLRNFNGNTLVASTGTTTSGGLQKFSIGYSTDAYFSTPLANFQFPTEDKARVSKIKVYWGEKITSAGNAFTLNLKTDRGATTTKIIDGIETINSYITQYRSASDGTGLPFFDSLGLNVIYSGGTSNLNTPVYIQAIEVYFDFIKI